MSESKSRLFERITVDPAVCGGRPCIRGLRVSDILAMLAEGVTREGILADYPHPPDKDIAVVLEYTARQTDHRILLSV